MSKRVFPADPACLALPGFAGQSTVNVSANGEGQTSNPIFSPDGNWIAFSADDAGNTDIYVVPATGGKRREQR